ncbi:unnamed protein product [Bursaphelenchus xylophilus]|uniref:(pine wood nematode) hypothetical protein n=1 Tax=Bursaphelenchus xylophilus TaxID=6326 RepID=A0A1I7S833_BURXY|nr:unnamed protein product [Bursaphelenchus xylophilus]CAG9080637.1 unnamed protein product [Bursaphelenchus xylophilus]
MSVSSILVSSSILKSTESSSPENSATSSSQSSGSFDNLSDLPFESELPDDNEEEIEEFERKCEKFWRNEKVGGQQKIKKSRMYLHLNARIRPHTSYKYWFKQRQERLQRDKTMTSTSASDSEFSTLETASLFEGESSEEYIVSDGFNVTRINNARNEVRTEDGKLSFSMQKVKLDEKLEEFDESWC